MSPPTCRPRHPKPRGPPVCRAGHHQRRVDGACGWTSKAGRSPKRVWSCNPGAGHKGPGFNGPVLSGKHGYGAEIAVCQTNTGNDEGSPVIKDRCESGWEGCSRTLTTRRNYIGCLWGACWPSMTSRVMPGWSSRCSRPTATPCTRLATEPKRCGSLAMRMQIAAGCAVGSGSCLSQVLPEGCCQGWPGSGPETIRIYSL